MEKQVVAEGTATDPQVRDYKAMDLFGTVYLVCQFVADALGRIQMLLSSTTGR